MDEEYEGEMESQDYEEILAGLNEENPEEEPFEYDEDEENLAATFYSHPVGLEAIEAIYEKVERDFEQDWKSAQEYRDRASKDWKLFAGDMPEKTFPFENCANANVPIMMENLTRLSFRIESEIFGDWTNVMGVQAMRPDSQQQAEWVNIHGNWQLREDIPDFQRQMARLCLIHVGIGDATVHSYWDPIRKQNCHEVLTPFEFVTPFAHATLMPDYSDVPRLTRKFNYYEHEIEQYRDIWYDVDKVIALPPPDMDGGENDNTGIRDMADFQGKELPEETGKPYEILWHETWLKLPNQDRHRYCKVLVECSSRHVLHLSIHEEADWRDQLRYEEQVREATQYATEYDAYSRSIEQSDELLNQVYEGQASGQMEEIIAQQAIGEAQRMRLPPPATPDWATSNDPNIMPEKPRKMPIRMFHHGVLIEPMEGNLGLGYGRIQADYGRAGNTLLNQFIDSATFNNTGGWLGSEDVDPTMAELELMPGKLTRVKGVTGGQLRDSIMEFKPPPPSPAMKEALELIMGFGQSSIQAPDVLSGEPGKSGETAKGILARIEQATKQLTVTARHLANLITLVLRANARLNAKYLPESQMMNLLTPQGQPTQVPVSRRLYQRDLNIALRADLRFTTKVQKVAEADEVLEFTMRNPLLAQNMKLVYAVVRKSLEARGMHDLLQYLPNPAEIPVGPPGMPQQPQGPPMQ